MKWQQIKIFKKIENWITFGALCLLVTSDALACAVCGFGEDESSTTYLISTAFLSLVPLGLIGGIIYWVYKVSRRSQP